MVDRPTDGKSFPDDRYRNPETALGGADAVQKTTYVTGSGTDPDARMTGDAAGMRKGTDGPSGRISAGAGLGATWVIIIVLFVGAVLVYLLGFGR